MALSTDSSHKSSEQFFNEESEGIRGYIAWETHPGWIAKAAAILAQHQFDGYPEFQLQALPTTNPRLKGTRFIQYHEALGPPLSNYPRESWETVQEEKSADMLQVLQFPFNGETPGDRLVKTFITPNQDHFVRNHGGIPKIDAEAWYLDVGGMVKKPQRFKLDDLKAVAKFPQQQVAVTLQCSGTRRIEQIQTYPGNGDELINAPWGEGAIGTAKWTGVSLKKVLKYCGGIAEGAKHLEFVGADTYFKKGQVMNYVTSVPWRKVKANEVMLVWAMNGEPLPRSHGYPVRVIVPGYIGARSVKWLMKINALADESSSPVTRHEYLYYTNQESKYNSRYSSGVSIQDMPVSSAIMTPVEKSVIIHDGTMYLKGWAYSGGGHWPTRVEVSMDGGAIWYAVPWSGLSEKHFHTWRIWEMNLPIDAEGWIELCVRCWDDAMNTQPTFQRSAWNWDMHVTSSCHRVKIFSVNKAHPRTRERLEAMKRAGESLLPLTRPLGIEPETTEEYEAEMLQRGGRDPVD